MLEAKEKFEIEIENFEEDKYSYTVQEGDQESFIYDFQFQGEFIKKYLDFGFKDEGTLKDIYGIEVKPFNYQVQLKSHIIITEQDDTIQQL